MGFVIVHSNLFFYTKNMNVDHTPHHHPGLARTLPVPFRCTLNQAMYERWLNFVRLSSLIAHLTRWMRSGIPLHRWVVVVDERSRRSVNNGPSRVSKGLDDGAEYSKLPRNAKDRLVVSAENPYLARRS